MDEGTKAIIKEIAREICDTQYEKIEGTTKEHNKYLDGKFECVKKQIEEVKKVVGEIKTNNCVVCMAHVKEHKEKERKIIRNVSIISASIPTVIMLGGWIKSVVAGWLKHYII